METRRMRRIRVYITALAAILLQAGCSQPPMPRPYAYFRIDLPEHAYTRCDVFSHCEFDMSAYAVANRREEQWAGKRVYVLTDPLVHMESFEIQPMQGQLFDLPDAAKLLC